MKGLKKYNHSNDNHYFIDEGKKIFEFIDN